MAKPPPFPFKTKGKPAKGAKCPKCGQTCK